MSLSSECCMSNPQNVDPGTARKDMITDTVDHDELAAPIWTAQGMAISAATNDSYAEVNIPQLLKSMRETHGSMRAIITAAKKIEEKCNEPTGRWSDALLLTRAQFDSVFIGLLLDHNGEQWGPKYYKAGWATDAERHFYCMRRYRKTAHGQALQNSNIYQLKQRAKSIQVTTKEWIATLADIRGKPLRFGASAADKIKPLPTPGMTVFKNLLLGGETEILAQLLWRHWKFFCDASHSGLSTLAWRHAIRDEQVGAIGTQCRKDWILREVVNRSIIPSFVAIMTLVTIMATRHKDNVELRAAVTKGWEVLEAGTVEGGIIWEEWAKKALGVLDDPETRVT